MSCALTAAGSDSGGGAGIEADLLSFAANGVYGCAAIAALTAQNPRGVANVFAAEPENFRAQLDAVVRFYKPAAAKTGMLFNVENVEAAADFFAENPQIALVADPVMIATSGAKLLKNDAARALRERLLPLSKIFTPNLDEAAVLAGIDRREIDSPDAMRQIAEKLAREFGTSVLVKGGHLPKGAICDTLAAPDEKTVVIESERMEGVNTHGSGCTLSAAIAANLARGFSIDQACRAAQKYLLAGLKNPLKVGGEFFINHFPREQ